MRAPNTCLIHLCVLNEFGTSSERNCEATLRSCKESPDKNSEVSTRLGPIDLHDTDAMLYQLSYEASLKAGQERVQFYTHYMKRVR